MLTQSKDVLGPPTGAACHGGARLVAVFPTVCSGWT